MGCLRQKRNILSYSVSFASPQIAQETFIESQNDKHSDLRGCIADSVTVMAVAADLHRDSLILYTIFVDRAENGVCIFSDELRLFFCVGTIIA